MIIGNVFFFLYSCSGGPHCSLCAVALQEAADFSPPLLKETGSVDETKLLCCSKTPCVTTTEEFIDTVYQQTEDEVELGEPCERRNYVSINMCMYVVVYTCDNVYLIIIDL